MARSKTVTLKGAACQAFFKSVVGQTPDTPEEARNLIATRIYMSVKVDDFKAAATILQLVEEKGVKETADILTAKDRG